MRILYYLHQFPAIGGIETVTVTLANAFVARGYEVTIVSHLDKGQLGAGLVLDARVLAVHMPDTCNTSVRNREFLHQIVRTRKIDVVIFQDSYVTIERNLFPLDGAVKSITVEHSAPYFMPDILCGRPWLYRVLWHVRHPFWKLFWMVHERKRRCFNYEQSNRYVLLSDRFFGEFRSLTGLQDTRKLLAIPNPLAAQSQCDGCEKCNEIVFCATLSRLKGCDMLLQIWRRIQNQCPDWRLTIIGDGPDRALLEHQKEVLKLERCTFEGYHAKPSGCFARAKIFAFPSRREGWGLVLVEAMANGCVPVAFDSYGAVRDIINDGVDGFVIPAFDSERFAQKILSLIEDEPRLKCMAVQAMKKVTLFSVSNVCRKWEHLIEVLGVNK